MALIPCLRGGKDVSGRKVVAAAFGVVALFWAVFASAYIGGKIDANDVMRDEWLAGREALEEVAEDLLRRQDVSGVVGETYRNGGAAYRYVFGERKFMSAEKQGHDAVLFIRKKSLGFELGLLYVRGGGLPVLDYARVERLDSRWYAVTVREPQPR